MAATETIRELENMGPKDSVAEKGIEVPPEIAAGAIFGGDLDCLRYQLWRVWNPALPIVVFVMCNPSTATATVLDPTVKKVIRFAKAWGYGGVYVVNLFAFRATQPEKLVEAAKAGMDVVGPKNDAMILEVCNRADKVICAWSSYASLLKRGDQVKQMLLEEGIPLYVLELSVPTTKGVRHPWHPLYISETVEIDGSTKAKGPRLPFLWR